jgi:hypothetical protein
MCLLSQKQINACGKGTALPNQVENHFAHAGKICQRNKDSTKKTKTTEHNKN